jgi:phytoene synthase
MPILKTVGKLGRIFLSSEISQREQYIYCVREPVIYGFFRNQVIQTTIVGMRHNCRCAMRRMPRRHTSFEIAPPRHLNSRVRCQRCHDELRVVGRSSRNAFLMETMSAAAEITDDTSLPLAFSAARNICRKHAKSFFFASAFLPIPKRHAAYAIYAFCRLLDDAIDQPDVKPTTPSTVGAACCSTNSLDQTLSLFRERLDDIYQHRLSLPLPEFRDESQHALYAFAKTVHQYQIPQSYFNDLAEGCRMDITISRYATWTSLEKYCYRVAGVVGLIMSCVFGVSHSDAGKHAVQLGNAMQLTNILRDVKDDWARGRLYLPLEDLARFKVSQADVAIGKVTDGFRELMKFEIARARELYRQGAEGLCWLAGDGSRLTASAMAVIYSGILTKIEHQNYDVFSDRAHLTVGQKLSRIAPAWRLSRRKADRPLPKVFA